MPFTYLIGILDIDKEKALEIFEELSDKAIPLIIEIKSQSVKV
jgi:hypothetical protein